MKSIKITILHPDKDDMEFIEQCLGGINNRTATSFDLSKISGTFRVRNLEKHYDGEVSYIIEIQEVYPLSF